MTFDERKIESPILGECSVCKRKIYNEVDAIKTLQPTYVRSHPKGGHKRGPDKVIYTCKKCEKRVKEQEASIHLLKLKSNEPNAKKHSIASFIILLMLFVAYIIISAVNNLISIPLIIIFAFITIFTPLIVYCVNVTQQSIIRTILIEKGAWGFIKAPDAIFEASDIDGFVIFKVLLVILCFIFSIFLFAICYVITAFMSPFYISPLTKKNQKEIEEYEKYLKSLKEQIARM